MDKEEVFTIDQAAEQAECTPAWIRRAIREGKLKSTLAPVSEGSHTNHRLITRNDLQAFLDRDGKRVPRREDRRGKWVFYATDEEVDLMKELLYSSNDEILKVVASTIRPNKALTKR